MGGTLWNTYSNEQPLRSEQRVSVRCSCSQCDSLSCFIKRKGCFARCSCENCYQYMSCPAKRDNEYQEIPQKEINYEIHKDTMIKTNNLLPYTFDECCGLTANLSPRTRTDPQEKPKTLTEYIEAISGQPKYNNRQEALESYIVNLKKSKPLKLENEYESKYKNMPKQNDEARKNTLGMTSSSYRPEGPLIDAASEHQSELDERKLNDISPSDISNPSLYTNITEILTKLMEVYKACSCKVCQCIPTKIIGENPCTCKPCECIDCNRMMNEKKIKKLKLFYGDLTCKIQTAKDCSCKPCECLQCRNKDLEKSCDCAPCECIQCISKKAPNLNTIVVTPALQMDQQKTVCKCLSCECIECDRQRNNIYANLMENNSSDTYLHDMYLDDNQKENIAHSSKYNEGSRPGGRNSHDFKKETETIINAVYQGSEDVKGSNNHSMLAMYAAVPPAYANYDFFSNNNIDSCKCQDGPCIACLFKKNGIDFNSNLPSFNGKTIQAFSSEQSICGICNSKPCQCQVSFRDQFENETTHQNMDATAYAEPSDYDACSCDYCECQDCTRSIRFKDTIPSPVLEEPIECMDNLSNECNYLDIITDNKKCDFERCRCTTCRCERCFGDEFVESDCAGMQEAYPIKKGEVLTPSVHQYKVQKLMLEKESGLSCDKETEQSNLTCNQEYTPEENLDIKTKTSSRNKYTNNIMKTNPESERNKFYSRCDMIKYDTYVQCQEWNKEKHHIRFTNKQPVSLTSVYSSSVSKSSLCKDNFYETSFINKSRISSCNSSGHDRSDYLIRFPKLVTEACLDDVLKAHLEHTVDPKVLDFCLKHNCLMSDKENVLKRSKNVLQPIKSMSTTTDTKDSLNEYKTRNDTELDRLHNCYDSQRDIIKKYLKNRNTLHRKDLTRLCDELNRYNTLNHRNVHQPKRDKNVQAHSEASQIIERHFSHLIHVNQPHLARTAYNYECLECKEQLPEFMRDEDSWTNPKRPSFTCFNHYVDTLNMDDDYERVYKTIKEAEEFSAHLLKLLAKYEKANQEFEKITDQLKISQESIFSKLNVNKDDDKMRGIRKEEINAASQMKETMTLWPDSADQETNTQENMTAESTSSNLSLKLVTSDFHESLTNTYSTLGETNSYQSSGSLSLYETIEKLKQSNKEKIVEAPNYSLNTGKTYLGNLINELFRQPDIKEVEDESVFGDIDTTLTDCNEDARLKMTPKKSGKKHSSHLKRIINVAKRVCSKNPRPNISAITECVYDATNNVSEGQIGNSNYYNPMFQDEEYVARVRSKQYTRSKARMAPVTTPIDDEQDSESAYEDKLKLKLKNPLKVDKEVSPKRLYVDKEVLYCDQDDVSLDGQKAKFLLVRKISDHTVLVKWRKPSVLTGIQGYELLVDGCAVQKIFNPSNYMAVVTCLPNTDKILLTLRTITSLASSSGHYPASTIIYQPRIRIRKD